MISAESCPFDLEPLIIELCEYKKNVARNKSGFVSTYARSDRDKSRIGIVKVLLWFFYIRSSVASVLAIRL